MARGRKPKPPHLRLIDGTHRPTRHGSATAAKAAVEQTSTSFGPLIKPKFLKGHAREAWTRFIAPASWLDASREPSAVAFCELWNEMRRAPSTFQASKHSQMRAYMSELGLTDERRRKIDVAQPPDDFFD